MENKPIIQPIIIDTSPEYKLALEQFRQDMYQFYLSVSHEVTPEYDSDGTQIIKPKPGTDFKFIIAAYMEKKMHQYFPETPNPVPFLAF